MSKTGWLVSAFIWFVFAIWHAWGHNNEAKHLAIAFVYFVLIMSILIHVTKPNKEETT